MMNLVTKSRYLTCAYFFRLTVAWDLFGRKRSNRRFSGNNRSPFSTPPTALQEELIQRSAQVRLLVGEDPSLYKLENTLYIDSSFHAREGHRRGFCNWIVPGFVMIGQYPGQTPESGGPTHQEVRQHIQKITQTHQVSLFCSLQTEIPSQNDSSSWWDHDNQGRIFLEPPSLRRQFPHPFTHYAPIVREYCQRDPIFLHHPIEDLNVPDSHEPLEQLLLELLNHMSQKGKGAVYLHCWGGRGRGGLVGACLLSLLWPTLTSQEILDWIQRGYATRLGHDKMPLTLSKSPQTTAQRDFVHSFVQRNRGWQQTSSSL